MHKGKRFWVSCRQLGITPETKEASILAANQWWTAKQAELDAAHRAALPPPRVALAMEDMGAAMLGSAADWPAALAEFLKQFAEKLAIFGSVPAPPAALDETTLAIVLRQAMGELLNRVVIAVEPLPDTIREQLPPARVNQIEASIKGIRGEQAAPAERTVSTHAAAWISSLGKQADAGQVTIARVNNVRTALAHLTKWLGEMADVGTIDAAKLQGFYEHCLTRVAERRNDKTTGWSVPFAKEVFSVARAWLRWLTEQGTVDAPRNLVSRFRFGMAAKEIPTWTEGEVRHVINEAPGKLKLALLLMANCGMTQQDVSDLKDTEVDWQRGTITRKRSKAANYANAPTVEYPLWPLTWKQLQKYRSGTERVLLTESGKPYIRRESRCGKFVKADGFTSNYTHLKKRLKFTKSMKLLRKTSASLLENHVVTLPSGELVNPFAACVTLFLGHSPRSMKDRHYAAPPQALFDNAVLWLGQQFGFASP